jgi:hypothetical protein
VTALPGDRITITVTVQYHGGAAIQSFVTLRVNVSATPSGIFNLVSDNPAETECVTGAVEEVWSRVVDWDDQAAALSVVSWSRSVSSRSSRAPSLN